MSRASTKLVWAAIGGGLGAFLGVAFIRATGITPLWSYLVVGAVAGGVTYGVMRRSEVIRRA